MIKNNCYLFQALIFTGDTLIDTFCFEQTEVQNVLNETKMKILFEKLLKKYLPEEKEDYLVNYSFNDNMPTNFPTGFCDSSKEISYDLTKYSPFFKNFVIEDLNITLSLEYFYKKI